MCEWFPSCSGVWARLREAFVCVCVSVCVCVCVCVCRGSSQRGPGKKGGGSGGREQGSAWVGEGRGGKAIRNV